jgi:hypothetical protein
MGLAFVLSLAVLLMPAAPASAGGDAAADPWSPFRGLIGVWRGEAAGFGAVSDLQHEWELAVQDRFLRLRTRSVQRAEDGEGEVHEDLGYLSRDTERNAFVFRHFLSEGFVNTFDVIREGDVIRFEARESESAGGMRARMVLTFDGPHDYGMVLELAGPGGDFSACQEMTLRRVKGGNE